MLKYLQIRQRLVDRIDTLKAGDPLPPVRKLLSDLHCSQATLKRALDPLESQGMVCRRPGSGIFVMERLLDHGAIGMIASNITTRMSAQIMQGIQNAISDKSCTLIAFSSRNVNPDHLFLMLRRSQVFGVIINPTTMDLINPAFLELVSRLGNAGVRMVGVDLPLPGVPAGFVTMNNHAAFSELGMLLRRQKVHRMAFVGRFSSKMYTVRHSGICNGLGSMAEIVQIDSSVSSIADLAEAVDPKKFDAVVLADANTSIPLTYELRCKYGDLLRDMIVAGIVEEGECLPWKEAWSLEKPNSNIAQGAVSLLLNSAAPCQTCTVEIKIKLPADHGV